MTVSPKMIAVAIKEWSAFGRHERSIQRVTQETVNSAWSIYDSSDESTWPEEGYYWTMYDGRPREGSFELPDGILHGWRCDEGGEIYVTYYANPDHLMFKEV